ncbi:restriction endonuclease subunit S [Microcoleus sp. C2C3]|uniref:restriction endonuclease subunit S n=1 Tax=unclassified Microcoleus TaxID=2642155 RepID=UPI002FD61F8F
MTTWPLVALGDIFDIARGGSPRPIQNYITDDVDGVNWIMIADASESSKYITSTKKRIRKEGVKNSRMVYPGDFVLTNSMSFGRPYIMKTSGCIHDGWLVLSNRLENVDSNYFFHLLGSNAVYLEFARRAAGATVKNLNIDLVKGVQIPLPPLEEQKRIAEILDRAEELRSKRREAIAQLDTLTQAIFFEMFGEPVLNGWAMETIAEIVHPSSGSIRTGPFGSNLLHSEFVEEGVAVLGIDNAVANEFRWGERRFISELKYRGLKHYTVRPGDVIITIMGTCGRCAVVPDNIPVAINTKHLCCITLNPAKCLPRFLHAYFLLHPIARQYLNQTKKGAIMAGLNMAIIKSMPIFIPSLSLQKEFTRRAEAVDKLKAAHRASLSELDALFASLQHRAFRGEL